MDQSRRTLRCKNGCVPWLDWIGLGNVTACLIPTLAGMPPRKAGRQTAGHTFKVASIGGTGKMVFYRRCTDT